MDQLKNINKLSDWKGQLRGKTVFLRADLNVPVQNGQVQDDFRIESTMPTIYFLMEEGAKIVVASHIETADVESPTLRPIYEYIKAKHPELSLVFCENFLNEGILKTVLQASGVVLLENIRQTEGDMSEKENSINLAMYLKEFVDLYVNDAFAVSHRTHATVDALPKLFRHEDKAAGFLLTKEIYHLYDAVHPAHPFFVILSGMKFSTKLPLIKKYLVSADKVLVGGALFNNIAKSLGHEVGVSLVDLDATYIDALVKTSDFVNKIYIPDMVVVKDTQSQVIRTVALQNIQPHESIQDIAPVSIQKFLMDIQNTEASTVLWNGPVGNYEVDEFSAGTKVLAEGLISYARAHTNVKVIIGGGDTVAALKDVEVGGLDNVYISTAGGAMLEFLEKEGEIPGVVSLL